MKKIIFAKRSEMTAFALSSGLEIIRCKLRCNYIKNVLHPSIILIDANQIVQYRLVKCKMCKMSEE